MLLFGDLPDHERHLQHGRQARARWSTCSCCRHCTCCARCSAARCSACEPPTGCCSARTRLALFIALAKRRADLVKGLGGDHRPALDGYNESFLDQAIGISAGMTIFGYALYSMEAAVLLPSRKFAALPFVVFGVLDYLRIAHVNRGGGSPVDMVLRSPKMWLCGVGWLAATLWSLRWKLACALPLASVPDQARDSVCLARDARRAPSRSTRSSAPSTCQLAAPWPSIGVALLDAQRAVDDRPGRARAGQAHARARVVPRPTGEHAQIAARDRRDRARVRRRPRDRDRTRRTVRGRARSHRSAPGCAATARAPRAAGRSAAATSSATT